MTRRFTTGVLCLIVFVTLGANVSEAQLVKSDFLVEGDGLLVTDLQTGLVWLSPLYTSDKSYNEVLDGFGDLLTTHGFQFATADQVRALINTNFDNPPVYDPGDLQSSGLTPAGFVSANEFFEVFGVADSFECPAANPPGLCPRTQGWAVDPGTLTGLGMITLGGSVGGTIDYSRAIDDFSNFHDPQLGVWLYRPNTSAGSDVSVLAGVTLPGGEVSSVSLVFENVDVAGGTTVTASDQGPSSPSGFKLTTPPVYYDITTTAAFTGDVRICLSWAEGQIANESKVRILHFDSDQAQWVDITDPTSRDTVNNVVCGTTTSFSLFSLMETTYPFTGFFQPVDNLPTTNAVKAGSAVPVKFSLGGDQGMSIFASGYPRTQLVQCDAGTLDPVEETVTAGGSSLSYDVATGIYSYIWKTDKAWANSCRELQLMFDDGEVYKARFTMRK